MFETKQVTWLESLGRRLGNNQRLPLLANR